MTAEVPWHTLNDQTTLPGIGLGTAPLPDEPAEDLVRSGIGLGYRFIDTGAIYGNERGVGAGVLSADAARRDVRVLTKIRGRDQGDGTREALRQSLSLLGLDYVDLYLIHWPMPSEDRYLSTWETMIGLREEGLARSIGVSNFLPEHLSRLRDSTGVVPSVNQIEVHPGFAQDDVRAANAEMGIRTLGYSPLGHGGDLLSDPTLGEIANANGVTPAQVALRWQVELGSTPLPRTAKPDQQAVNLGVFSFTLEDAEVAALSDLPIGRIGWDPATRIEL